MTPEATIITKSDMRGAGRAVWNGRSGLMRGGSVGMSESWHHEGKGERVRDRAWRESNGGEERVCYGSSAVEKNRCVITAINNADNGIIIRS